MSKQHWFRAVGATALVAAIPLSSNASAASNGAIAFSAPDDTGIERVFTVQPDGSGRTLVTGSQGGRQSGPVWSPDGARILYESTGDGQGGELGLGVWVMDANGGNATLVTPEPAAGIDWADSDPSWSPDGTQFVWATSREDGNEDIYIADIDGANARPLIVDEPTLTNEFGTFFGIERYPAWSPDGTRIAFFETGLTGNYLSLVDVSGTGPITQVVDPYAPFASDYRDISWSPDGTRLLVLEYVVGSSIPVVMVADMVTGEFFDVSPDGYADFSSPSFSPDGTQIIVSAYSFATGENGILSIPNPPSAPQLAAVRGFASATRAATTAAPAAPAAAAPTFLPGTTGSLTSDWGAAPSAPVCTITGTERSDRLIGTSGNDVICALGGNDIVIAGRGDDVVIGGAGNDVIDGGAGDDAVHGDAGRDALTGGTGSDRMFGGDDPDLLIGIDRVRRNDVIDGGAGRDACTADRGDRITAC